MSYRLQSIKPASHISVFTSSSVLKWVKVSGDAYTYGLLGLLSLHDLYFVISLHSLYPFINCLYGGNNIYGPSQYTALHTSLDNRK